MRAPNAVERARATGRAGYLLDLGLDERQLYDLVGNHFDPDALIVRTIHGVNEFLHGRPPPRVTPLHPRELLRLYDDLRGQVLALGVPAEEAPFPRDLMPDLLAFPGYPEAATAAAAAGAAEDGREHL